MKELALLTLCLASLAGAAPPEAETEARTVPVSTIPHITAGGGWRTTVRVANPTRSPHEVRLESYRANGAPMPLTVNGQQAYTHTNLVAPQGVLDLTLSGSDSTEDGYAFLLFLSGTSLPHTVLYEWNGQPQGSVGKAGGGQYSSDYFQFDNTGEGTTGIAFLLPVASYDVLHRLTCYAANGAILGTFSFPMKGTRAIPAGGFEKHLLSVPGSLGATEGLKGICYFSIDSPTAPIPDKPLARPVISLRFLKHGFLPLTF